MTERQEHLCRILADPVNAEHRLNRIDREAIAAALAEVERLRDRCEGIRAAAVRHAQDCGTEIEAQRAEVERLRGELAAARANPPSPAAIVWLKDPLELHAFESFEDSARFHEEHRERRTGATRLRDDGISWVWHPRAEASE